MISPTLTDNQQLTYAVLQKALDCGVREFCICPSARNAPLVIALTESLNNPNVLYHFWFEERSAAFFALGRSRNTQRPVAVITTSGTAVAELLPATMEAHYSGVPLLLITADRPRRFRGTGAPQSAEQVGIFSHYIQFFEDLATSEISSLENWHQTGPAHSNVCLDEPLNMAPCLTLTAHISISPPSREINIIKAKETLKNFLKEAKYPFIVVSTLQSKDRKMVRDFLLQLNAPTYIEAISGLREDSSLNHLRITIQDDKSLFENASYAEYPIDRVLRIGGVPTFRLWRDLDARTDISVCSLTPLPFSGLSQGRLIQAPLQSLLKGNWNFDFQNARNWILQDQKKYALFLEQLKTKSSEIALVHRLSKAIPKKSLVYLGNSLPIREWDRAAICDQKGFEIYANRGVNGIDGQISTFLGLCDHGRENWAILGDLTTLYDMVGPWYLAQQRDLSITFVILNNGGGQIFSSMFSQKAFLHKHKLSFKPFAEMWNLEYLCLTNMPEAFEPFSGHRLIEVQSSP